MHTTNAVGFIFRLEISRMPFSMESGRCCYRVLEPLTGRFTFCWCGHMRELAINHEPTNIWPSSRLRRHHCGVESTMESHPLQSRVTCWHLEAPHSRPFNEPHRATSGQRAF